MQEQDFCFLAPLQDLTFLQEMVSQLLQEISLQDHARPDSRQI